MDRALDGMVERWKGLPGVSHAEVEEDHAELLVGDANEALPHLFEEAARGGSRITSVNVSEPNLELVFLHLTGRALRE